MMFFQLRSTSADEVSCFVSSGGPLVLLEPNGEPSNTQVGIVSWGVVGCYHPLLPSVFTRVSEVADWVKETVCTRKGELCKGGTKSAKAKVMKTKYPDTCVPVGTDTPTMPYPSHFPTGKQLSVAFAQHLSLYYCVPLYSNTPGECLT